MEEVLLREELARVQRDLEGERERVNEVSREREELRRKLELKEGLVENTQRWLKEEQRSHKEHTDELMQRILALELHLDIARQEASTKEELEKALASKTIECNENLEALDELDGQRMESVRVAVQKTIDDMQDECKALISEVSAERDRAVEEAMRERDAAFALVEEWREKVKAADEEVATSEAIAKRSYDSLVQMQSLAEMRDVLLTTLEGGDAPQGGERYLTSAGAAIFREFQRKWRIAQKTSMMVTAPSTPGGGLGARPGSAKRAPSSGGTPVGGGGGLGTPDGRAGGERVKQVRDRERAVERREEEISRREKAISEREKKAKALERIAQEERGRAARALAEASLSAKAKEATSQVEGHTAPQELHFKIRWTNAPLSAPGTPISSPSAPRPASNFAEDGRFKDSKPVSSPGLETCAEGSEPAASARGSEPAERGDGCGAREGGIEGGQSQSTASSTASSHPCVPSRGNAPSPPPRGVASRPASSSPPPTGVGAAAHVPMESGHVPMESGHVPMEKESGGCGGAVEGAQCKGETAQEAATSPGLEGVHCGVGGAQEATPPFGRQGIIATGVGERRTEEGEEGGGGNPPSPSAGGGISSATGILAPPKGQETTSAETSPCITDASCASLPPTPPLSYSKQAIGADAVIEDAGGDASPWKVMRPIDWDSPVA